MKNKWIWFLGIALAVIAALVMVLGFFTPYHNYLMMGYGWHMPMMYNGIGMMGVGIIMLWLVGLGLLVLIGLSIAWLVRALAPPKS